jgi:GNAT superfamily N-acetyltransferase
MKLATDGDNQQYHGLCVYSGDHDVVAATFSIPDTLVTTYLEMTHRAQFRPAFVDNPRVNIIRMDCPDVGFYRFLYSEVGRVWRWRDRLVISEDELRHLISRPGVSVHVVYVDGVPAGYVELYKEGDDTEIAYFGLRTDFMGMGLGKHLLSYAIDTAWAEGARRVWVHTCNLDASHALENYMKRGLQVYHVEHQPMPQRYAV